MENFNLVITEKRIKSNKYDLRKHTLGKMSLISGICGEKEKYIVVLDEKYCKEHMWWVMKPIIQVLKKTGQDINIMNLEESIHSIQDEKDRNIVYNLGIFLKYMINSQYPAIILNKSGSLAFISLIENSKEAANNLQEKRNLFVTKVFGSLCNITN